MDAIQSSNQKVLAKKQIRWQRIHGCTNQVLFKTLGYQWVRACSSNDPQDNYHVSRQLLKEGYQYPTPIEIKWGKGDRANHLLIRNAGSDNEWLQVCTDPNPVIQQREFERLSALPYCEVIDA